MKTKKKNTSTIVLCSTTGFFKEKREVTLNIDNTTSSSVHPKTILYLVVSPSKNNTKPTTYTRIAAAAAAAAVLVGQRGKQTSVCVIAAMSGGWRNGFIYLFDKSDVGARLSLLPLLNSMRPQLGIGAIHIRFPFPSIRVVLQSLVV
jgi:hypothetical protein